MAPLLRSIRVVEETLQDGRGSHKDIILVTEEISGDLTISPGKKLLKLLDDIFFVVIGRHKEIEIFAVVVVAVIVISAVSSYYVVITNELKLTPLPFITAENGSAEYNWSEYFSNSNGPNYYINGLYANDTMNQPGCRTSNVKMIFGAEDGPSFYMLVLGVLVSGNLSLNPLPTNITIYYNNALPGVPNLEGLAYRENVSLSPDSHLNKTWVELENRTALGSDQTYHFEFDWNGDILLPSDIPFDHTYILEFMLVFNGLSVPVHSLFTINYTNVKA